MLRPMKMRTRRFALLCGLAALLAGCGGPATECADIGAYPGVDLTADAYQSDATVGHTVEVCADGACGTVPLDEASPFVVLDDLREKMQTTLVVVVSDQQGRPVRTTTLTVTPAQYKPGGDACQYSVALLRLSLTPDGTAETAADQDRP